MTLHKFIQEYQKNNNRLDGLFTYELKNERNIDGYLDQVTKLTFADGKLNFFLANFKSKYGWVAEADIEAYFIEGLEKAISKANTSEFNSSQLINWIRIRLDGHIKNQINKMDEHEEMDEMTDGVLSMEEWERVEYDSPYAQFLEQTGGLQSILSSKQHDIYQALQVGTQEEVAAELGVSQQAISKTMTAGLKRVKTQYLQFKTFRALTSNTDSIYDKITRFQKDYLNIVENDEKGNFNYYNYTINFLRDSLEKTDTTVDYESLQKNKLVDAISVLDALIDNLKQSEQALFRRVLGSSVYRDRETTLTDKEKDKFVMATLKAFKLYEKQVEESVQGISKTIVTRSQPDNYPAIAKSLIN